MYILSALSTLLIDTCAEKDFDIIMIKATMILIIIIIMKNKGKRVRFKCLLPFQQYLVGTREGYHSFHTQSVLERSK